MIEYRPWSLRGYTGHVYMVWVESPESLCEVKEELNNPPVKGLLLVENKSRTCERLGWEKLDDGLYFRLFE